MRFNITKKVILLSTEEPSGDYENIIVALNNYSSSVDNTSNTCHLYKDMPMVQDVNCVRKDDCTKKRINEHRRESNESRLKNHEGTSDAGPNNNAKHLIVDKVALRIIPLVFVCISFSYWTLYLTR